MPEHMSQTVAVPWARRVYLFIFFVYFIFPVVCTVELNVHLGISLKQHHSARTFVKKFNCLVKCHHGFLFLFIRTLCFQLIPNSENVGYNTGWHFYHRTLFISKSNDFFQIFLYKF